MKNFKPFAWEFVQVEDNLKLQDVDQKVKSFILTYESENLSKKFKILGQPNIEFSKKWILGCPDILDSFDKFSASCVKMKILTH